MQLRQAARTSTPMENSNGEIGPSPWQQWILAIMYIHNTPTCEHKNNGSTRIQNSLCKMVSFLDHSYSNSGKHQMAAVQPRSKTRPPGCLERRRRRPEMGCALTTPWVSFRWWGGLGTGPQRSYWVPVNRKHISGDRSVKFHGRIISDCKTIGWTPRRVMKVEITPTWLA
jgi:hypothetical protein